MALNPLYQFTLNNGSDTVLSDEPLNWNESKIQVERDDVIKGLFVQYITEVQFVGDGYTYLLNEVSSQGICGTVDIKIEYRLDIYGAFETLFEGVIYLKDIKENVQKQIITVDIQDANFSRLIRDRKDFKVSTAANASINNESITAPTSKQVYLHRPQVDSYGTYANTVRAYSVFDLFKLAIEYITDDQVAFESDFFSGLGSRPETWNLNIAGAITPKTYTLEIVNEFGTFTGSISATGTETLEQIIGVCLDQITDDHSKSPTGYEYDAIPPYNGIGSTTGTFYDGTLWQTPYCIQSLWPISSMTLTDGVCNKIQELEHNMGELHVTYGRMIFDMVDQGVNSGLVEFAYSFNDLFQSLNDKFDLTFELYDDGGTPTCKIEPTKDFFSSSGASSASFTGINDIEKNYTLNYKKSGISLKPESVNLQDDTTENNLGGSGPLWSEIDIDSQADFNIVDDCGEDVVSTGSGLLHQTKAYNKMFFDKVDDNGTARPPETYNERLFLVDIYESGGSYYSKQYLYSTGIAGGVTVYNYLGYNFFLSTFKNVYYWMFSLGNTARMTKLEIDNDNTLQFDTLYTFNYPISKVDWSAILNNLTDKITIGGQGLDSTDVWIESIEIDPYKGMAQFSVISSS